MFIRRKILIATLAASAALAVPSSALAASQAPATPAVTIAANTNASTPSPDIAKGAREFKNLDTGLCILVKSKSAHYALDGPCNKKPLVNREWTLSHTFVDNGTDWFLIENNRTGGGCLATGPGGVVVQKGCARKYSQQDRGQEWRPLTATSRNGYYQWVNRGSNECLGLASTTPYGGIKIAPCASGHPQQYWDRIKP